MFYDSKVLGAFCEALDPSLSFEAYKRANGACDDELIKVATTHSLFRALAKYCVERQNLDLWAKVLTKVSKVLFREVVATSKLNQTEPFRLNSIQFRTRTTSKRARCDC